MVLPFGHPTGVAVQRSGRIVIGISRSRAAGDRTAESMGVLGLTPSGAIDRAFGSNGKAVIDLGVDLGVTSTFGLFDMLVGPDGRILLAGRSSTGTVLARFTRNGKPDRSFGKRGVTTVAWASTAAALAPDGKIVLAGDGRTVREPPTFGDLELALGRLLANGRPDMAFAGDGRVNITDTSRSAESARDVGVRSDGRITVLGDLRIDAPKDSGSLVMARVLPDGAPDSSFPGVSHLPIVEPYDEGAFTFLANGRMLWAGMWPNSYDQDFSSIPADFQVVRLDGRGLVDPTFGTNGSALGGFVNDGERQGGANIAIPDAAGRIVAGGYSYGSDLADLGLVRHLRTGEIDPTFGVRGRTRTTFRHAGVGAVALATQTDGRIVVAGRGGYNTPPWGDPYLNGPHRSPDPYLYVARYRGGSDRTAPRVWVADGFGRRCIGGKRRLRIRIGDSSPLARVVVSLGGRLLRETTSRRVLVTVAMGHHSRRLRIGARDVAGNHRARSFRLRPCG